METKIAIIDKNVQDRKILMEMLERQFIAAGLGVDNKIEEFSAGEAFLSEYQTGKYMTVFLDIYLSDMNGMDVARKIYEQDQRCQLIFYTSSRDYAVESYRVRAAYYLVKPLLYEELQLALRQTSLNMQPDPAVLPVTLRGGGNSEVYFRDILYVECVRRTVVIHKQSAALTIADKLGAVVPQLLQDSRFICCNRGIYVNMDWIEELKHNTLILKNGEVVPIRIHGRGEVKREYLNYMLRSGGQWTG